uniref:Uncharacterized protein n=1 Tax=Sinocyclocheilus rhinocerous TaxID=307959 RepID=A0A673NGC4_9TELE
MLHKLSDLHGILFSNGENWKEMRRFALSNLRDFGMGKRGSEEKIIEEIQYLKGEFDKFEEKPFDTTQPYAVSNIISSIVYGSRFEYTDPRFTEMVDRANENVRVAGSTSIMVCMIYIFPFLGPILKNKRIRINNIVQSRQQMTKLINGLQETLNPHDRRGFVDSFLIRKQSEEKSGKKDSYFHEENLMVSVTNLFVAGTDTTGMTLRWGLMLMAKYPHIQGKNTVKSRGTTVVPLLTSVLKDPKHFLDKKGQFVKRDAFMPFSAGTEKLQGYNHVHMSTLMHLNYLMQTSQLSSGPPAPISSVPKHVVLPT